MHAWWHLSQNSICLSRVYHSEPLLYANLQNELNGSRQTVQVLQSKIAQLQESHAAAEREARHSRRLLRMALSHKQKPTDLSGDAQPSLPCAPVCSHETSSSQQTMQSVETPVKNPSHDQDALDRLKRLEDGVKELLQRRSTDVQLPGGTQENPLESGNGPNCGAATEAKNSSQMESSSTSPAPHLITSRNEQRYEPFTYFNCEEEPVPSLPATAIGVRNNTAAKAHGTYESQTTKPSSPSATTQGSLQCGLPSMSPESSVPAKPLLHQQFLAEMPHELTGYERPGVRSRFPHRVKDLRAIRAELQAELHAELEAELEAEGIDASACRGLTPAQYTACIGSLRGRRAIALKDMEMQDRAREQYMRDTVMRHVDGVAKAVSAAVQGQKPVAKSNRPLASHDRKGSWGQGPVTVKRHNPATIRTPVEQALLDVTDEDTAAFYSPLHFGNSGTGSPRTPRS